jgi:SAM-dependent methyltransferase
MNPKLTSLLSKLRKQDKNAAQLSYISNLLQQVENNQALLKQYIEYRAMEIENNNAINLLKLRRNLVDQIHKTDHCQITHSSGYEKAKPNPYEDYLKALEQLAPEVFPVWQACFQAGEKAYYEERSSSCSSSSNIYVTAFQAFIAIHARGHLLDQGCGIYGLPSYLEGYPLELISAVEPLPMAVKTEFEVVRGFAEFLPWPDASFTAIVNGTSLDHVLSLDKSLAETHRVLHPDGKFLVWIGSIKGAKPYDLNKRPVQAIDKFHLFHFHEDWFEALMSQKFSIIEKITLPTPSFDHIFYAFKKR